MYTESNALRTVEDGVWAASRAAFGRTRHTFLFGSCLSTQQNPSQRQVDCSFLNDHNDHNLIKMIRRQPTLIALSDTDVQDAKSMLEKLKNAAEDASHAAEGGSGQGTSAPGPSKKELSKEERLGLR